MGIRDKPIAAGSPWQNSFAERLIETIRRECVDHIVVLGATHLRRSLREYARYYNTARTHQSLDQDAPVSRPVQQNGWIVSHALVGGLHHQYVQLEHEALCPAFFPAQRLQSRAHGSRSAPVYSSPGRLCRAQTFLRALGNDEQPRQRRGYAGDKVTLAICPYL